MSRIERTQQGEKKRISGIVTDSRGEVIIGANIVEKGTTNGIITDVNGRYSLNISPSSTLQISYIGYLTQDFSAQNKTSLHIILKEDFQALEEVVVVGYGTQKKEVFYHGLTQRILMVRDGRLVLPHGTSYRILVLPKLETIRPSVLRKIERLVADGAVVFGPPPSRSPSMENYPAADQEVRTLAANLWGDLSVKQRSSGRMRFISSLTRVTSSLRSPPGSG